MRKCLLFVGLAVASSAWLMQSHAQDAEPLVMLNSSLIEDKKVLAPNQIFRDKTEGQTRIEFTVKAVSLTGGPFYMEEATNRQATVGSKEMSRLQVIVTEKVEARLHQLGIEDLRPHFYGKLVRVSGNLKRVVLDNVTTYTLVVDNLDQLESVGKK